VTHEFHSSSLASLIGDPRRWINQLQQQIIEFQRTEIDVLKKKLGKSGSSSTMTSDDAWP